MRDGAWPECSAIGVKSRVSYRGSFARRWLRNEGANSKEIGKILTGAADEESHWRGS